MRIAALFFSFFAVFSTAADVEPMLHGVKINPELRLALIWAQNPADLTNHPYWTRYSPEDTVESLSLLPLDHFGPKLEFVKITDGKKTKVGLAQMVTREHSWIGTRAGDLGVVFQPSQSLPELGWWVKILQKAIETRPDVFVVADHPRQYPLDLTSWEFSCTDLLPLP